MYTRISDNVKLSVCKLISIKILNRDYHRLQDSHMVGNVSFDPIHPVEHHTRSNRTTHQECILKKVFT